MKRTILIIACAVFVTATAAFAVGRASNNSDGSSVSADARRDPDDAAGVPSVIEGAEHVHAVTYLPGGDLLLGSHGGLFRSADGGRTWDHADVEGDLDAMDFMSLVPDPREPDTLFAGGHGLGVVRSADGGATWLPSGTGIDGTDIHALALNPRQPDDLFAYSVDHGVYRSTDSGSSWDRLDDGPDNPGVRAFAYMAVQTDMDRSMGSDNWGLLFAGTSDGLFDSFACFCGWHDTTDEFDGATIYSLTAPNEQLGTMYAGTTNGLWKSTDQGKTWVRLEGISGRVATVAVDPSDPDALIAVNETGEVYASGDAGATWERRNG